ncbi:MAG: hypothetical protein QNK33_04640 [Bacteroidales bacterium]|nr:hypothetical protein [Bacteroidales bacterium]
MDLKSTIAIILKDLEDARNILDDIKKYPGVPAIQVELAKAKCRSAGEVIRILVEEEENNEETQGFASQAEPLDPSVIVEVEKKVEEIEKDERVELLEEKFEIDENLIDEVVQPKEENPVKKDDTSSKKQIIADKFSKQSSINERMESRRHEDESAELSKILPVLELGKAVGINERFMFIRELFNGDQDLYKSTLDQLNKVDNIDSAFGILAQAAPDATGAETFDQLLDLVKRKLAT